MNTKQDALETLRSRIDMAQKMIDLYVKQLREDPQTALYAACKQHIQACAYLYTFNDAMKCMNAPYNQSVEEFAEVVRKRVYSNAVSGQHLNSSLIDVFRRECENAAWGELMEILGDPITLEQR